MPPLWLLLMVALLLVVVGQEAGPPTWPDGAMLTVASMGIGEVLLSWPIADNNVNELVGYEVQLVPLTTPPTNPYTIFSGIGYPSIRDYLVTDLTPGTTYGFYILAVNVDATHTNYFTSVSLYRSYTPLITVGRDPTVLGAASFSVTAGVSSPVVIQGKQPSTGFDQDVGPICLVTQVASCVVGRTFVAFVTDKCSLVEHDSRCEKLYEGAAGWSSNSSQLSAPAPLSVGFDPLNDGYYTVELTGRESGAYSLGVQAIFPEQILGLYWGNEEFEGAPVDVRTDAAINFNWTSGSIIEWIPEYVSVRWLGYLKPELSEIYTLACFASTYCDVWVDDELVISSIHSESVCASGCVASKNFSLKRSHYYRLRVDYIALTGDSFIQLKWKPSTEILFAAIPSGVYHRGAFVTGSPYSVTVLPGIPSGVGSYVYGSEEALKSPFVGKRYTLFVQVADEFGNACTSFSPATSVIATVASALRVGAVSEPPSPSSYSVVAKPFDPTVHDCIYAFSLVHEVAGEFTVSVTVNGEPVRNSPIVQVVDPLKGVLSVAASEYVIPERIEMGTSFDLSVKLKNVFGHAVNAASNADPFELSYRLFRDESRLSGDTGCGPRSNFTYLISCWRGEFVYIDDSQLIAGNYVFPTFVSSIQSGDVIDASGTQLGFTGLQTIQAGPHSLFVLIGDEMVGGGPAEFDVAVPNTATVEPSMCLVHFFLLPTSAVVAGETEITARVLMRDSRGNVLTSRAEEVVEMVLLNQKRVSCSYVPNKYYECSAYSDVQGTVTVSIEVAGHVASMTEGTVPSKPVCFSAPKCGTPKCPCEQRRVPATVSYSVSSDL